MPLMRHVSVSSYMRHIQILATEMYKRINNLSPPIMKTILKMNCESHYNLRQTARFSRFLPGSVYHETEDFYLRSNICDVLFDNYKTIQNLNVFKDKGTVMQI